MKQPIRRFLLLLLLASPLTSLAGCTQSDLRAGGESAEADQAFEALQARGEEAMGIDQYTSTHHFDALRDGGRIELQRDGDDPAGVEQIRQHLQEITHAFRSGDFSTPAFVHMQGVPGTPVMAARREAITYTYSELPRGGQVRMTTHDAQALEAIHEFMAFQRQDHRAGGMLPEGMHQDSMHHHSMQPGGTHTHQDGMSSGGMNPDRTPMPHDGMRGGWVNPGGTHMHQDSMHHHSMQPDGMHMHRDGMHEGGMHPDGTHMHQDGMHGGGMHSPE